jgi:adenosylhomocysteine nucleosidase
VAIFALEQEFAAWRRLRRFERKRRDDISCYEERSADLTVTVALTGMGAERAGRVARALLAEGADVCVSSGLAGGLKPGLRVGQVVVARTVSSKDSADFLKGDTRLVDLARECGAKVVDRFLTSDELVLTAVEKARLGRRADAVEMEGLAVLAEAARMRIPAVAIRAISDTTDVDLPLDFSRAVRADGELSMPRVLGLLAQTPQRLPGLMRLGRDGRKAGATLAAFLDRFVMHLAVGGTNEIPAQLAIG